MLIPCADIESSDEEDEVSGPSGSSGSAAPSTAPVKKKKSKKTVFKWIPGTQVMRMAFKKAIMPTTEGVRAEIQMSALGDVSSSDGSSTGGSESGSQGSCVRGGVIGSGSEGSGGGRATEVQHGADQARKIARRGTQQQQQQQQQQEQAVTTHVPCASWVGRQFACCAYVYGSTYMSI